MTGNVSCAEELPGAGDYLRDVSTVHLVFICICGALTAATLAMYIETLVFLFRNLYNWKPKDKAKWVLAVYPIHTITSFISLVVPRSSNVNELVAACYFSVCIYQFVTMLIGHYGGAKRMSEKLTGASIRLNTNPCCCCCVCLPAPGANRHNIHVIQTLVIQYAVAGPILAYCMAIVWANNHYYQNPFQNPASYMNLLNTISSLVAAWGMSVTFGMAGQYLTHAHITQKFYCVQFINLFTNIQSFLFDVLVMSRVIECDELLNADAVGVRYHHICLTFEMFALWIIARYYYRRDISDIPVDDQVYVDTCNVGTSVTGTLERSLSSHVPVHGPTSARQYLKQDSKRTSLNADGTENELHQAISTVGSTNTMRNKEVQPGLSHNHSTSFAAKSLHPVTTRDIAIGFEAGDESMNHSPTAEFQITDFQAQDTTNGPLVPTPDVVRLRNKNVQPANTDTASNIWPETDDSPTRRSQNSAA